MGEKKNEVEKEEVQDGVVTFTFDLVLIAPEKYDMEDKMCRKRK